MHPRSSDGGKASGCNPGSEIGPASDKEISDAAIYISKHPEIKEVLLTGGDMFTLSDERIDFMLSEFRKHCPGVILRLCTRAVAVYPERFTDNLMSIIRKHLREGAPFYLMTQFNHPAELTDDAVKAVAAFVDIGIPAMNQSVLLKGVNDDAGTLTELSEKLLLSRIKPYYLFQGDPVRGKAVIRPRNAAVHDRSPERRRQGDTYSLLPHMLR